jgi:hypothetical protein
MANSSLLFSARYETIGGILYRYSSSRDAEISNNVGYRDVLPRIISAQNYQRQERFASFHAAQNASPL